MTVRLSVLVGTVLVTLCSAAGAQAGEWIQASCVNPDGTAAPSEGWSVGTIGGGGDGSGNGARCGPGSPMYAIVSTDAPVAVGSQEYLQYTPPTGSTLAGGTVNANLYADGGGTNASGTAVLYEPGLVYPGDVFFQCAHATAPCDDGGYDYSGTISLPAGAGGDLFIAAGCGGAPGYECNTGGSQGAWALVQVNDAYFALTNSSAPEASGFSGSALQRDARGTAHLVFTAMDPSGPGIYRVAVQIDGRQVWAGTPSTNNNRCAPVATFGAALIFDWQQPCPQTEVVDAPVPTTGLSDGKHELAVTVIDAASNSSTVFDQEISTSNPVLTPKPRNRHVVQTRFRIRWHWHGTRTQVLRIAVAHLPRSAHVAVRCAGRSCPRLHVRSVSAARIGWLLSALRGLRLHAGDRLLLTVSAPRRGTERIELKIRNGRKPAARVR